ncbi:MAG: sigma-70 family RNA polymerase sigma factor [Clostridia bacterium]|nr:sigma-70 family RNA polymerase sigma factor [Clostridia bacterium]
MDYATILLNNYSSIRPVIRQLNHIVHRQAVRSHNNGLDCWSDTQKRAEKIVYYVNKKKSLINLHNVTTKAINSLAREDRTLIYYRYIVRATRDQIAKRFSFSQRTVYRRLQSAKESFEKALRIRGYDEKWFKENYGKDFCVN